jgi:hypothetical protein
MAQRMISAYVRLSSLVDIPRAAAGVAGFDPGDALCESVRSPGHGVTPPSRDRQEAVPLTAPPALRTRS